MMRTSWLVAGSISRRAAILARPGAILKRGKKTNRQDAKAVK